jgi:hypothetical protein
MVIGPRLAWTHIPRTGGDAAAAMLAGFPDLVTFRDPPRHPTAKHHPFHARGIRREVMAMNLRRLPAWVLSVGVLQSRIRAPRGLAARKRLALMPDPMALLADAGAADRRLRYYLGPDDVAAFTWLRMEALKGDLLALVGRLRPVTSEERARVAAGRVRKSIPYDHNVFRFFGRDGVARLYADNPAWAALERAVYGSLLA